MMNKMVAFIFWIVMAATFVSAQSNATEPPKKANARATAETATAAEPFDGATVEKMASQCVTLETELGAIEIAFMPEVAPESVRNFVIQGGNLSTSEKWSAELAKRMGRRLPDEPGLVKHVRGVVSMARTDEPNSATTHFFILVGPGPHLDSKFSAFGTVTKGMEVADAINQAPVEGEKPEKPVKINRAVVVPCKK
jgi:peptidyl-prolyl cis-trans isomerase B (cyclophilin B)